MIQVVRDVFTWQNGKEYKLRARKFMIHVENGIVPVQLWDTAGGSYVTNNPFFQSFMIDDSGNRIPLEFDTWITSPVRDNLKLWLPFRCIQAGDAVFSIIYTSDPDESIDIRHRPYVYNFRLDTPTGIANGATLTLEVPTYVSLTGSPFPPRCNSIRPILSMSLWHTEISRANVTTTVIADNDYLAAEVIDTFVGGTSALPFVATYRTWAAGPVRYPIAVPWKLFRITILNNSGALRMINTFSGYGYTV